MFSVAKQAPVYLLIAVILHVVVVVLFVVSFHWIHKVRHTTPAVIKVQAIAEAPRDVVPPKPVEPEPKPTPPPEEKPTAQELEQQRLELERKRVAIEQEREKKRKEQEAKRLEDEYKREQQRREKEFKEKIIAEQKKLETEQKRLAAELVRQEQDRKQQEEAARIKAEDDARKQTIIDKYRDIIHAHVRRHWIEPPNMSATLMCELRINLIPSGEVINIRMVRSSGEPIFDRSVENAVRKASPLPLPPPEAGLFEVFRDLHFRFGRQS